MDKKVHKLKTWPAYFLGLRLGMKNFEVRVNDRDYQVGDFLLLQEFIPSIGYTGKEIERQITYILKGGEFGIAEDTVVMSLSQWPPQQAVSDEEIEQYAQEETDGEGGTHAYHAAFRDGKHDGIIKGAKWMRDRTAPSEAETILRGLFSFENGQYYLGHNDEGSTYLSRQKAIEFLQRNPVKADNTQNDGTTNH